MSEQAELQRIENLANHIFANYDYDTRQAEPFQLLAAVLHNLTPDYFNRPIQNRKPTSQLLPTDLSMKEQVKILYSFVASSTMSNLLKCHLLGDAYGFIKSCGATSAELAHLDSILDVRKAMQEFWLFEGLE